jgi:UDP-2,3-diacylglucosamine pyrophosphatase LpxH
LLIIVSDLHLMDGTCGIPITPAAFQLFADRIKEMATSASWRSDHSYRPLENIDILLMGDIIDPLHSTRWFDDQTDYVRPWTSNQTPAFAAKIAEITHAILEYNADSIRILQDLTLGKLIHLKPADRRGRLAEDTRERIPVPVRIHYMVGNHDWYYHLPGAQFDAIRAEIVSALGLSNPIMPFPHEARESDLIQNLFERYKVHGQHGDMYDAFNYDTGLGRNAASLGDAFTIEMVNRFPVEVERRLGGELSGELLQSLHELVNVRPTLVTPLWISGQLRQNNVPQKEQSKIKSIWDELGSEFLDLDFVRKADQHFKLDTVDAFKVLLQLTRRTSFKTIDDIVVWIREKLWSGEMTFAQNAIKETAFLNRTAQFIVYGHTHHHEIVPLDSYPVIKQSPTNQIYFNSGTWHTYYDLGVYKPREQKFIPYQVLTYLTFFRDDQRGGRRFETWSGSFSE